MVYGNLGNTEHISKFLTQCMAQIKYSKNGSYRVQFKRKSIKVHTVDLCDIMFIITVTAGDFYAFMGMNSPFEEFRVHMFDSWNDSFAGIGTRMKKRHEPEAAKPTPPPIGSQMDKVKQQEHRGLSPKQEDVGSKQPWIDCKKARAANFLSQTFYKFDSIFR